MCGQMIASERLILRKYLEEGLEFPTEIRTLRNPYFDNPVPEKDLGEYRPRDRRKCVTADLEVIMGFIEQRRKIPGFLEAGPRQKLAFAEPSRDGGLRVAVVTTGGLAPGLNSVVHSIVERHLKTYRKLVGNGVLWGIQESFRGLAGDEPNYIDLDTERTEGWLHSGGCELGAIRYMDLRLDALADRIATNLKQWGIDILYVIGGDGSLTAAHAIAARVEKTIVVGIPKTMDNDILWVWKSFGFNTAVERAESFINTMHSEAESTRRVSVLEFFGARSGFVAANAALASGHVDLVLIPEVFEQMNKVAAEAALQEYVDYLRESIIHKGKKRHAVVVIAEGVGKVLAHLGVEFCGNRVDSDRFPDQFSKGLKTKLVSMSGRPMPSFTVQPKYYIRAIPANSHDQIYCKRLGALAVDNALAGYTDFMISQWLTEYVLVPLSLVAGGQKRVPPGGIFWKQVVASTRQPPVAGIPEKEDAGGEGARGAHAGSVSETRE